MLTVNLFKLSNGLHGGNKFGALNRVRAVLPLTIACIGCCALPWAALAKDAPATVSAIKDFPSKDAATKDSATKDSANKGSRNVSADQTKIKDKAEIPAEMLQLMDQFVLHEAKTMGGVEYAQEREIGRGKMTSCLADCFIVLYLLEGVPSPGSNNNTQYMAAFTYIAGKPLLLATAQIGGRGLRYASIKSIGPDDIKLTTETYRPKDPMSTPSGKGHATYVIADKHLIEMP